MAALTEGTNLNIENFKLETLVDIDVKESTTLYRHALVCADASDDDAVPAADTSGFRFLGMSRETYDNSSGSSGDVVAELRTNIMVWIPHTGLGAGDVGTNAVVSDDNTVTNAATATNDIEVGQIMKLSGSEALVWLGHIV